MNGLSTHIILLVPWLLFLGLGFTTARLVYQAWQEQALLDTVAVKLRRERQLHNQKQNFVKLSSHYLRTPLALITNGIEAMVSLGKDKTGAAEMSQIAGQLKLGVNGLLEQSQEPVKQSSHPPLPNINLYLMISMGGALIVVSAAIYLLANLDFSNFKLSSFIGEIAVLIMAIALVYSARRSKSARQLVRKHFEELLAEHRALDKERNLLVKNSLEDFSAPLAELKDKLKMAQNQPLIKPVSEGIRSFEAVLNKFIILSSLEAGDISILHQSVSLSEITGKISERYRSILQRKKLQIKTDFKADQIKQDPLLLEFVLNSLVENAIEHSPEGKSIDIISRTSGELTNIFVRDSGPGIPAEKFPALFEPFSRAENVEEFEHQGLGLSLYLDRLIVRYLGGKIAAESQPGKATVLKLQLPG